MISIKSKVFQLILVTCILLVIITSSIKLTFDSFNDFYSESSKTEKQILSKISDNIYNFYPIKLFRTYSGFETGYGFFGPNVSSDFILLYDVYDDNGEKLGTKSFELSSKEGSLRFTSLNRLFLDKITKASNKKYNRYIEIILKQISEFVAKDFPNNYTIKLRLYLYDFPSIDDFNGGSRAKLYLIKDTLWKN